MSLPFIKFFMPFRFPLQPPKNTESTILLSEIETCICLQQVPLVLNVIVSGVFIIISLYCIFSDQYTIIYGLVSISFFGRISLINRTFNTIL